MVRAYEAGLVKSYAEAGEMFGVGEATFNRIYRLYRTTGSVERKPSGHRPRSVDNEWLETHAEENPEALLRERIEDWKIKSGKAVSISTMSNAMKRIGWTHKKNSNGPRTGT
ncbi:MAG: hypothetical protein GY822_12145 [Deltaproteobacteria bacterium]|nr:hypothetical protein [Deltaproteobacteria bacterium]